MSRFRYWSLLAVVLPLSVPAAAGPLDLPEFDQNSGHFFDGSARRPGSAAVLSGRPPLRGSVPKLEPAPQGKPRRKRKPFFDDPKRQAWFEEYIGANDHSGSPYFLGDSFGPAVQNAFHPVLGVAVGVADRLYGVMTVHVLSHVLPDDLSNNFEKKSSTDSYASFDRIFHEKEAVFLRDLSNNYPRTGGQNAGMGSPSDYQRYRDWQNWAGSRQIDVFANSFGSWAIERYRLEATGDKFGQDIKKRKNWTPGTIAVAIVGGGVMGWFFGIQQPLYYGPMRMHVNLHSADAVVRAMQNDGGVGRVAGVELGPKDDRWPVAYFNEEIKGGKWVTNTYGLKLSRRFHTRPWD